MSIQRAVVTLLIVVLLGLVGGAARLVAQVPGVSPSATVALVVTLPPGGFGAVIQRKAGSESGDLILLDDSSSIADLASALSVLRGSRKHMGERVSRALTISIRRSAPANLRNPVVRQRLQDQMTALHAAPARQVEGVGIVRAIIVPVGRLQGGVVP